MTVARDLVRIKLLLLWKPKDNDKINQYLPSIHSDHKVYWKSCYYLWTVCQMGSITVTYLSKTCKMILPGQIFFPVPMRACVISCFSCVRFCESQRTVACQAPRIPFKGVRLELLTPICKREKSDQYHLSTGGVPPCSRWGCRQTVHQSFSFLVRLSLSLTVSGATLVPPRSTTETGWGCTRGRPDGIPTWSPALHH